MSPTTARARRDDLTGLILSGVCLIHCLALPLALLLTPALSAWIALPEGFHALVLVLVLPVAAMAMRDGWRQHRRLLPAMLAGTGLSLLIFGLSAHEGWIAATDPEAADRLLTSGGAIALAAAHLINWRWRHRGDGHRLPG